MTMMKKLKKCCQPTHPGIPATTPSGWVGVPSKVALNSATGSKVRTHWASKTIPAATTATPNNVSSDLRNFEGSLTTSFSTVLVAAGLAAGGGVTTSGIFTSGSEAGADSAAGAPIRFLAGSADVASAAVGSATGAGSSATAGATLSGWPTASGCHPCIRRRGRSSLTGAGAACTDAAAGAGAAATAVSGSATTGAETGSEVAAGAACAAS